MRIKRLLLISTGILFCIGTGFALKNKSEQTDAYEDLFFFKRSYNLEELKYALSINNSEIKNLQEEYKRSQYDLQDARAGYGPTVDFQLSGTYMVNPPVSAIYLNVDDLLNQISWPTGVKPKSNGQYVKLYDGMENTLYNAQITLQQPIFTWGKITNAVKLYSEISRVKETQILSVTEQKENELEIRLVTLEYLYQILDLLSEEEVFVQRMVEFSENAEAAGMMLHQDVVDAKIQAKQLEIAKQDVNEQVNSQLLEIRKLTGIVSLSRKNINYEIDEAQIEKIMQLKRYEVEERAISGEQISIKMLTQLEEINQLAEKIAKGYVNWKPDVALQLTAGYGGSRVPFFEPNWLRKDDYTLNVSLGIKTTVWDGGKKVRDVSRKISETKTAQINQEDARSTIIQTLNTQWKTADVCTLKIDYQDLKIESGIAKIQQKETEYSNGYGTEADVLSAKIDLCNQKIERVKQSLSRAVACMTIKYLGGK